MRKKITALLSVGMMLLQSVPFTALAGLIEVAPGNMVFLDVQYPDGSSADGVKVTLHNAAGTEIGGIINDESFFERNDSGIDGTELGDDRYCYFVPWSTFTPYVAPQTLHSVRTCRTDWEVEAYAIYENEPVHINGGLPYKVQLYSYDASQATALTVPANQFGVYVDPKWANRTAVGFVSTPMLTYYFNKKGAISALDAMTTIPVGETRLYDVFNSAYEAKIGLELDGGSSGVSAHSVTISSTDAQYVFCRMPLYKLCPYFREDGKFEKDNLLYDLRQDTQYTSAMLTIQSGSIINAVIPDSSGYVEFYLDKASREYTLDFCYYFSNVPSDHGTHISGGSGFGYSGVAANITEHFLEALQPPTDEIVLTQVPAGTYTLTYEEVPEGFAAPKTTAITVANSKEIQYVRLALETAPLPGDVNFDRLINAADAAILLSAAAASGAGGDSGLNQEQIKVADLNADAAFDALDAAIILQYAAYAGAGGKDSIEDFIKSL